MAASASALAQQSSAGQPTDSAKQPTISDTTKEFDVLLANSERLRRSTASQQPQKTNAEFLQIIPRFRKATEDFRTTMGTGHDVRTALRDLKKLIGPLADYLDAMKLKPHVDAQEFKDYTNKDLTWEALTTAERVDNNLQRARLLMRETARSGSVSIATMEFYTSIQTDLARLKSLADRVESSKAIK